MVIERQALLDTARLAQECFLGQTWPAKQLVVFNATGVPLNRLPLPNVVEIRLHRMARPLMLSVLRENADGEWCVTWDPDCWYASTVLERHMKAAERETAVVFKRVTAYCLTEDRTYVIADERIVHGSFLRTAKVNFETPFYQQLPKLNWLDVPAELVIKFVNTIQHE